MTDETLTEYFPISISTIEADHTLLFDTHIKIADRYILYLRRGKTISADRLKRLKKKKVTRFYILQSELKAYNEYLGENFERTIANLKHISPQEQLRIFHTIHQQILLSLMEDPFNEFRFNLFNKSSDQYFSIVTNLPETLKIILSIENLTRCPAHHGLNLATLFYFTQLKLKLLPAEKTKSLLIGCQLHDIILLRQDIEIGTKEFKKYTLDEKVFNDHGEAGAALLKSTTRYDELSLAIVKLHEKTLTPEKNPKKITDPIELLGSLAGLLNIYDHETTLKKSSPKEEMQKILLDKMGYYHLEHFQALQDTLKEHQVID